MNDAAMGSLSTSTHRFIFFLFCLFLKLKLLSISGDCYCGVVLTQNWFEMHTHRISGFLFCCPFCLSIPVSELDLKAQNWTRENVDLTMVLFSTKCKHCWGDWVCERERAVMLQRGETGLNSPAALWGRKDWLMFWRIASVGAWNIHLYHGVLQKEAFWAYL